MNERGQGGMDRVEVGRVADAAALIRDAERVVVLTGAGISAESGVPTFRGTAGLWKSFRPEDLATPAAFVRDPRLVWEWYGWRRSLIAECSPNPAHRALASLALDRPGRCTIVTQNVDGLHHIAAREVAQAREGGPAHEAVTAEEVAIGGDVSPEPAFPLEVHGAIHRDRCPECAFVDDAPGPVDATSDLGLPSCPRCGALLRPDVVWFGEALDPNTLEAAMDAAHEADVCLVVGTSALVYPAASVPTVTAAGGGAVIEVNLEPTPLSRSANVSLLGRAGDLLPRILEAL